MRVNGILKGIKDTYLEILDRLYDMDTSIEEVINSDMLDILVNMTDTLNKEVSVFINRRGRVLDVSVGDYSTVRLPVLDYRRGARRLSGVRCIHTHPQSSGNLSKVDLSALISLRLDIVAAVGIKEGRIADIYAGYLVPEEGMLGERYEIIGPFSAETINRLPIMDIVRRSEKAIMANIPEKTDDNSRERALLVGLDLPDGQGSSEDLIDELEELAKTCDVEVVHKILQKRNRIDTAYYMGSGKAAELGLIVQSYDIDTVIFDEELSGAQIKNLEDITGAKIIDRTALILDIFARRAMTREGKLQVELAQLKYRMPRLIGLGKVLSRTGGGIGTRGPGEKKLETDRRHIRERIDELEKALEEVKKNRNTQRDRRMASNIPVVSLVGYTNAGKSTLRNYIARMYQPDSSSSKEDVLEADMLFATLDPTTRMVKLPKGHDILVSDTVGFIRKLPHDLVEAFKATLEEVVYSDMLIHVVDASAPNVREQIEAVERVLKQLNVLDKPVITVLNKMDRILDNDHLNMLRSGMSDVVEVSALNGEGVPSLLLLLESKLYSSIKTVLIKIPYTSMSIKSSLHEDCRILSEEYGEDSVIITAEVDESTYNRYKELIISNNTEN